MKKQSNSGPQFTELLRKHHSQTLLASLLRIFGPHKLQMVSDIVQDTFVQAAATPWFQTSGNLEEQFNKLALDKALETARMPGNPVPFAPEVEQAIESGQMPESLISKLLSSPEEHEKSRLGLLFACCHPALPMPLRMALLLKTGYAFSDKEVQQFRHSGDLAMFEQLPTAKDLMLEHQIQVALPSAGELPERLATVYQTLWQLFSEGYEQSEKTLFVRRALCDWAFRQAFFLTENELTSNARTLSLMSVLCFHAARFDPRRGRPVSFIFLEEKSRAKWDNGLVAQGVTFFEAAGAVDETDAFHLFGQILLEHTLAPSPKFTNWERILNLQHKLVKVQPTLQNQLQLAWTLGKCSAPQASIQHLYSIPNMTNYLQNWQLNALMGDFHRLSKRFREAVNYYRVAQNKAPTPALKRICFRKIHNIETGKATKKKPTKKRRW